MKERNMKANFKVCLPTAGKGSRLNEKTKYFNKALLRVGNKAVISYTIESFPKDTEFVFPIGYKGDIVKQFLEITYPERKKYFTFIEVKYGEGYGPGYAVSKCKELLQCPFYYASCDSIINWNEALRKDYSWSAYDFIDSADAFKYCTISVQNNMIDKIFDKSRHGTENAYIGISFIKDYKKFWENLEKQPKTKDKEIQISPVILNMDSMTALKVKWYDTGNEEGLQEARNKFEGLANLDKLDEELYIFDNFVVKYFHNKEFIQNRLERTKRLNPLVPKILHSSENFYKYQYIKGRDLSEIIEVDKVFSSLLRFAKEKLWKKIELSDFGQEKFLKACKEFYYNKTIKRLKKLNEEKPYIASSKKEYINNIEVPGVDHILSRIDWEYICDGIPVNFHGDFVFSNILYVGGDFKLIDWRQDFGGLIDCGDVYYDLAKLNAEFLIPRGSLTNEKFYITNTFFGLKTFIEIPIGVEKCKDLFKIFINRERYDSHKIKILTGLILLNMSPLHEYPLDEWLYYFGRYYLWRQFNE
jgi:choline kinase